jgi:hypothetical protein
VNAAGAHRRADFPRFPWDDTEVIMVGDAMAMDSTAAWVQQQFGQVQMPDGRLKKSCRCGASHGE